MKIFLIIITLAFQTIVGKSQTNNTVLHEDVDLLLMEYAIYQNADSTLMYENIINKAQILKSKKQYNQVCDEIKRAQKLQIDSNYSINYELTLNLFLAGRFNEAYNSFLEIPDGFKFIDENSKILWLFILAENHNWQKCKEQLLGFTDSAFQFRNQIENLPIESDYKSPIKAAHFSAFLPGLGQVYTGNIFKGITSFCLTTGAICLTAYEFSNGYFVFGTTAGLYPFIRLYKGGIDFSYKLAFLYNDKKEIELKDEYLEIIRKCNF
jgi:hypothetical protein